MTEKEKQYIWRLDGAIMALEKLLKQTHMESYLRQDLVAHLATYKKQHTQLIQAKQTKRRLKV